MEMVGVGNTVEENSSILSLISMHKLPSAKARRKCSNKMLVF